MTTSKTYDVRRPAVAIPLIGDPIPRYESVAKVTGASLYAADVPLAGTLYAALVTTPVAKGRVTSIDASAAEAVPGVRLVLTHENVDAHPEVTPYTMGGVGQSSIQPLGSDRVHYAGQIVGLVVAETIENAALAAERLVVEVEPSGEAVASMHADDAPSPVEVPSDLLPPIDVGDVEAALADAEAVVEASYTTPVQHHNPIELYFTSATWRNGILTAHVPSQWVTGTRGALATAFSLPVEKVRVVSAVVGGGFGAKATVLNHTYLTALAARRLGVPVKLYVSRDQMYTVGSFRPASTHRVRIGAKGGRLTVWDHEQDGQCATIDTLFLPGTEQTTRMYGWSAIRAREATVATDTNTPGFMRAPAEVPGLFALESAIDELSWSLDVDPVQLRIDSDSPNEPVDNTPWSSRSLVECYRRAAATFEWNAEREPPRSLSRGDWLIGHGCASTIYPCYTSAATADLKLGSDLSVRVSGGAHDLGTGTYTIAQQIVARELGVPMSGVRVELGDSDLSPNSVAGGSRQTASFGSALLDGCRRLQSEIISIATAEDGPMAGMDPTTFVFADGRLRNGATDVALGEVLGRLPFGVIEARGRWTPAAAKPKSVRELYRTGTGGTTGMITEAWAHAAFGAHFVEIAVDRRTGEVRVPRLVGAFAAGRIVNELTARSQLMGGMIWGVASALHEATEIDHRHARFVNTDLGEYFLPVNADVPSVEVELVEEVDEHSNPLGAKGVGELGIVGVNAAIANALHHATGVRVRELPIRMEKVLGA